MNNLDWYLERLRRRVTYLALINKPVHDGTKIPALRFSKGQVILEETYSVRAYISSSDIRVCCPNSKVFVKKPMALDWVSDVLCLLTNQYTTTIGYLLSRLARAKSLAVRPIWKGCRCRVSIARSRCTDGRPWSVSLMSRALEQSDPGYCILPHVIGLAQTGATIRSNSIACLLC